MIQFISTPRLRRRIWNPSRKDGGRAWQLDYTVVTDGVRRRYQKSFRTREKAEEHYKKVAAEVAANEHGQRIQPVTLSEYEDLFLRDGTSQTSEASRDITKLAIDELGETVNRSTLLHNIRRIDIDRHVAILKGRNRAASTIARKLGSIRRMFAVAVEWGYIKNNPARGVKSPRIPRGDVVFLELTDQRKLVAAAAEMDAEARHNANVDAPYLKPLVILALHTGLREAEIFNLRWRQIDFERKRLTIADSKGYKTKTGQARVLGLSESVICALKDWTKWFITEAGRARKRSIETGTKLTPKLRRDAQHRLAMIEARQPAPDRLVFPSWRTGGPLDNIKRSWGHLLRAAFCSNPTIQESLTVAKNATVGTHKEKRNYSGFPNSSRIGLHALRHTFAVTLARAGVPITQIKAAMGHASIRTTEIYLRFYPDEGAGVAEKLPRL